VKSQTNRDYIGNLSMLTESLPFVVGELVELRPAVVLMPNAVWKKAVLRAALCGAAPWSRFIPAPQFNATVVNVHLARHEQEAQRLRRRSRGSQLERWMTQLRRIPPGNAWRYLAYLHLLTVIEEPARKARQPQPQTTHAGHYKPC
ncbi:MAG: hypothetical protein JW741_02805, partial [Sedimentisphaerales bacterium]|nr:hypothetical protein [Sedimentisphaerales bacterium]